MKKKLVELIGRIQDGGAETLVKDYALLLDKDKFDVTVLCLDYKEESYVYKTLVENNVDIVVVYNKPFFFDKVFARIFGARYVARKLKKKIDELKPDIMHVHLELLEIVSLLKDSLNKIKLFFTCHNPPEMLIGDKRPKERDACRYLLDNYGLRIIALHKDMADEIDEMFDIDNTAVINNGVNFSKFLDIKETKQDIRKSLNIPDSSYVIGQVGRFAYQKNQEFSVDVFKEVLKINPDSYLLLIGRGNNEKMLKDKINEMGLNDKALILTSRDDIPRLLKAMDVFIFPSRFEGLGIVLIEAQVTGLPCVVSENIPHEAFQSNRITALNLDDDKTLWAKTLLDPVSNVDEYGDISNYDMNNVIKKLEDLYLS